VTVFVNRQAHDHIPAAYQGRTKSYVFLQQAHMSEAVGEDVKLSLNFFRSTFGEPPVSRFYATEILGGYGQAFPGLIHFSWVTYQGFLLKKGEDEAFRSHEVAHQWWGLGVNPTSYHDAWLSEGFATFASWWYTEAILGDTAAVRRMIQWSRDALLARRKDSGPVWLGTRLAEGDQLPEYQLIAYDKGAWVLRMLHNVMFDPDSGDSRFRRMMRDFYDTYRDGQASTEDFQELVTRFMGMPMDGVFRSWVYGTGIPTYEWAQTTEPKGNAFAWRLRVTQREVPDDFTTIVPVHFYFAPGADGWAQVVVTGPVTDFTVKVPTRPSHVVFNEADAVLADVKEVKWR
jgi:aminopeptidase N